MTNYSDIIDRLEKADGPSRELDAQITASLNSAVLKPYPQTDDYGPKAKWQFWSMDGAHFLGNENKFAVEPVTSSIDAAVAMCEWMVATEGRKLICFFCAGGQLTPYNADEGSPDYHPLAKIDNSVTVGWLAHVAFYQEDGDSVGPERYAHGRTASLAILIALFRALQAQGRTDNQ